MFRKRMNVNNVHFVVNYLFKTSLYLAFFRLMQTYLRKSHYTHLPVARGDYNATPLVWQKSSKWWCYFFTATSSVNCSNDKNKTLYFVAAQIAVSFNHMVLSVRLCRSIHDPQTPKGGQKMQDNPMFFLQSVASDP